MIKTISLARLVHPLPVDQFLEEHWPDRPYVTHGPLERFPELAEMPELQGPEAMAKAYLDRIPVWFPRQATRDEIGRSAYGTYFDPKDALNLYRAGATLFFQRVDTFVPAARAMARRLERELGFAPGKTFCSVFASRQGGGALPHFDSELNFAVQLRGRKRWQLAQNEHVRWPPAGYGVIDEAIPDSLRASLRRPLPRRMPVKRWTVDLEPGSVLYFPPGAWHATESGEASFHVVFGIWPTSWAELVIRELRLALLAHERWREPVSGVVGARRPRRAGQRRLEELLEELPAIAAALRAGDLLDQQRGQRVYRRNAAARVRLERAPGAAEWLLAVEVEDERAEISITPDLIPLVRWVLRRRRPFRQLDALAAAPFVPLEELSGMLETLVETNALTSRSAGPSDR